MPVHATRPPAARPAARHATRLHIAAACLAALCCGPTPASATTSPPGPADTGTSALRTDPPTLPLTALFIQPAGPRGLEPSAALRAADGQRVRLQGYMVGQEEPPTGHFLLTPRPVRLSEHADGDADDLPAATVLVRLPAAWAARVPAWRAQPLSVTGRLHLGRDEAADGRVTWVQLDLDPELLDAAGVMAPADAKALIGANANATATSDANANAGVTPNAPAQAAHQP